jgi:hypothetical protein
VGFEVVTAVIMKISAFCDTTPTFRKMVMPSIFRVEQESKPETIRSRRRDSEGYHYHHPCNRMARQLLETIGKYAVVRNVTLGRGVIGNYSMGQLSVVSV